MLRMVIFIESRPFFAKKRTRAYCRSNEKVAYRICGILNRGHKRHGQLFQNRYKSIICQEDAYLLELVRYIHLNPLRAKVVIDLKELDRYSYCGHSALMGKQKRAWQDIKYVLGFFGKRVGEARKGYVSYVKKGIALGRRPELVGGGLIRSLGGWDEVKKMRLRGQDRIKSDQEHGRGTMDGGRS